MTASIDCILICIAKQCHSSLSVYITSTKAYFANNMGSASSTCRPMSVSPCITRLLIFLTKSAGFCSWLTFILVTRSKLYQIDNKNSIVSHPIIITTIYLHPLNTKTGKDKFLTLPLHFIIALSHNAPALIVFTPPYILSLLL